MLPRAKALASFVFLPLTPSPMHDNIALSYMETPKVYIETTLFNFYFAETRRQYYGRTVDLCRDARLFFDAVGEGEFEPYTSDYVMAELEDVYNEGYRLEMLQLVADYGVTVLPRDGREEWLADKYIEATAIPAKHRTDALHIASAAVHGLDFIVSQNFEHIIKDKAIRLTAMVNAAEGFDSVGIYEPGEVMGDEGT